MTLRSDTARAVQPAAALAATDVDHRRQQLEQRIAALVDELAEHLGRPKALQIALHDGGVIVAGAPFAVEQLVEDMLLDAQIAQENAAPVAAAMPQH